MLFTVSLNKQQVSKQFDVTGKQSEHLQARLKRLLTESLKTKKTLK